MQVSVDCSDGRRHFGPTVTTLSFQPRAESKGGDALLCASAQKQVEGTRGGIAQSAMGQ
jgi:hypothetical protein